ncbi:hypothetical protein SAMN02983003_0901 [Devosia enhydra]|uniref:Uncharacterized protein n=1 Tax=Devosia enhydra TaxID=665118 RepID=A0A1K2HUK5_9HYPH|nr:hypothetical protein [Devosia enhydra]SFZ82139.1 hypothetical protein SAMN02983003_0901 [Devosia enhydra]
MKSLLTVLALLVSLGLAAPASAQDAAVINADKALVESFFYGSSAQAKKFVSGYTMLIAIRPQPDFVRRRLQFSGTGVMYFAPDGGLLAWSGYSKKIEAGKWFLKRGGNFNMLCVEFAKGRGEPVCASPLMGGHWIRQSTKGNAFGLKAGAPVRFSFGIGGLTLQKLASQMQ